MRIYELKVRIRRKRKGKRKAVAKMAEVQIRRKVIRRVAKNLRVVEKEKMVRARRKAEMAAEPEELTCPVNDRKELG